MTATRQLNPALRRIEFTAAMALPILFLIIGIARATPFVDDVPLEVPQRDDWFFYKQLAVSILDGGLSMPAIGSYVVLPHGFLYPYFLALVFAVTGVNAAYVYVIQSLLAGVSAVVLWRLVRRADAALVGIAFLIVEGTALYLDFVRRLAFKLLSENLFLILFAVFLLALARAWERRSEGGAALAGALLGLTVLSRTSISASAIGIIILVFLYRDANGRAPLRFAMIFAASFAVAMLLLPLREYAAIGRPNFDLILNHSDWVPAPDGLPARAEYYARRLLFSFGFTGFVVQDFRFRPHWLLAWSGVAAYLFTRVRWRLAPTLIEAALLIFLPLYMGAVIAVATVDNYGGRMVAAAIPFALVLAGRAAAKAS
jgi:hypothetical protein